LTYGCSRCCWWRWGGRTVVVRDKERWQLLQCNLAFCLCFFFLFYVFFLSLLLLCFNSFSFLCRGASLCVFLLVILPFFVFCFCVLPLLLSVPVSLISLFCICLSSLYIPLFFKQFFLSPTRPPVNSTIFFCFSLSFGIYKQKVGREVYYPCPVMT